MRHQNGRNNQQGDGEIDENFWAQAAADQAAARNQDGDDSKSSSTLFSSVSAFMTHELCSYG